MVAPKPQGQYVKKPDRMTVLRCRELVVAASQRHGIPPAWIIAHIHHPAAYAARKEVMRAMLDDLGLRRCQVALAFNRDLRRVRASEIGGTRSRHGTPRAVWFTKYDLLGQPLTPAKSKPAAKRPSYRDRYEEALAVLRLVAEESERAARWLRVNR